jgi:hypothetical protein
MDSLKWALSWLIVLAVGLAPMLVYWVARVIGRAIGHKARGPPTGVAPVDHGGAGAMVARRCKPLGSRRFSPPRPNPLTIRKPSRAHHAAQSVRR